MGRSLTASRDKTARLWEADSGSLLATFQFQGHDDVVQSAAFSADGQRVRGFSAAVFARSAAQRCETPPTRGRISAKQGKEDLAREVETRGGLEM